MEQYMLPARFTRTETKVSNSRFIASAGPAFSVADARDFIAKIKTEFHDATHNVPAFIIGHGSSVTEHCSDDREPSGTAGRPILSVLKGSDFGDIVLVVTRYFGGTKLGTGGLVRAYTNAAKEVIEILPKATRVQIHTVLIATPYKQFEHIRRLISEYQGIILQQDFLTGVTITFEMTVENYPEFQTSMQEITHGQVEPLVVSTSNKIFPLYYTDP